MSPIQLFTAYLLFILVFSSFSLKLYFSTYCLPEFIHPSLPPFPSLYFNHTVYKVYIHTHTVHTVHTKFIPSGCVVLCSIASGYTEEKSRRGGSSGTVVEGRKMKNKISLISVLRNYGSSRYCCGVRGHRFRIQSELNWIQIAAYSAV